MRVGVADGDGVGGVQGEAAGSGGEVGGGEGEGGGVVGDGVGLGLVGEVRKGGVEVDGRELRVEGGEVDAGEGGGSGAVEGAVVLPEMLGAGRGSRGAVAVGAGLTGEGADVDVEGGG